jgi:hypothetical protein
VTRNSSVQAAKAAESRMCLVMVNLSTILVGFRTVSWTNSGLLGVVVIGS